MRVKQVRLGRDDLKAGPEADADLQEGEFLVYPSTFTRTPDAYGDVVAKGAFSDGITKRKADGIALPGLFGHRMDDPHMYVATALDEGEDDHGWWVKGVFDLDDPTATKVYKLVKSGRLRELSFAFDVLDEGRVEIDGTGPDGKAGTANELRKLEVFEYSFVPIGANRDTSVVAVKSATDALVRTLRLDGIDPDGLKAGRVLSAKNEGALRSAYESIGAVLDALKNDDDAKAGDGGSGNAEDPARGNADDPDALKSARARLSLELASADFDSLH
jgi:HK97 family phage prohead protease